MLTSLGWYSWYWARSAGGIFCVGHRHDLRIDTLRIGIMGAQNLDLVDLQPVIGRRGCGSHGGDGDQRHGKARAQERSFHEKCPE
jgi:hypothetical protein